jgi:S1-C subfamily serine protease
VTIVGKLSLEGGTSRGAGFLIDPSGKLVTSFETVRGADSFQVYVPGVAQPVPAKVLAQDEGLDIALLEIQLATPAASLTLGEALTKKLGEPVWAVGLPARSGEAAAVTKGIVTAEGLKTSGAVTLLAHDAQLGKGAAGGPLVDSTGVAVGMNTVKYRDPSGLSFAVPAEELKKLVSSVKPAK